MSLGDVVTRQCEAVYGQYDWAATSIVVLNVAFVVIAWDTLCSAKRAGGDAALLALSGSMAFLAIGSDLFQIFATKWSRALDMGAIALFVSLYLFVAARRILDASVAQAAAATAVFVTVAAATALLRTTEGPILHGLAPYLWTAATLAVFTAESRRRGSAATGVLATGFACFLMAIVARGAGLWACDDRGMAFAGLVGIDVWLVACAVSIRFLMRALAGATPIGGSQEPAVS